MKRISMLLLAVCMIFPMLSAASLTAYAANENTVILFDASEQENGEVKIDVNVIENTGVYAMLLTLDYDASALTLTNVEYGEAFASLEPLASESYTTYPYKISYLGAEKKNDTSTGHMMTLTFAVNENVSDGEYTVKFVYKRNNDVSYLNDGELQTKNLIVNGAKLTLKGNVIDGIVTVPDDGKDLPDNNGGEVPDSNGGDASDNNDGDAPDSNGGDAPDSNGGEALGNSDGENSDHNGVIIGVIAAGSVVGAGGIALTVTLIAKKKKRKWIKV